MGVVSAAGVVVPVARGLREAFGVGRRRAAGVFGGAGGDNFDVAIFGVANPATEIEFTGFAVNEPAKAYALYATFDEEVEDHLTSGG